MITKSAQRSEHLSQNPEVESAVDPTAESKHFLLGLMGSKSVYVGEVTSFCPIEDRHQLPASEVADRECAAIGGADSFVRSWSIDSQIDQGFLFAV